MGNIYDTYLFHGGTVTGYVSNKLAITNSILNALILGTIYAVFTVVSLSYQYFVLYGNTYTGLLLMVVGCQWGEV
jgi:hypothetical protein